MLTTPRKRVVSELPLLAKGGLLIALAYLCLGLILPGVTGLWERAHIISTFTLTPAMRTQLVETLADTVSRRYLDAQAGVRMAAAVREIARDHAYKDITAPKEFAQSLTRALRDQSSDPQITVAFEADELPDFGDRNFPVPNTQVLSLPARLLDRLGRSLSDFGVREAGRSAAGIGYIRLTGFVAPELSAEKFAAAMDRVAGTRALIIDLRGNSGGSRDGAALLASYFFDRPTLLSEVVAPRTGERLQMWTRRGLDGAHYGSARPVTILTSHATFAAAEDFAYAMQARGRATIVGEVTRGGAHPVAPVRLAPHFLLMLPVAQSVSPVTHTNWEGAGVQPDVAAPADRARSVATIALLKRQLAAETDVGRRADIAAWLRDER